MPPFSQPPTPSPPPAPSPGAALRSAFRVAFLALTVIAVPAAVLTTAAYFTAQPALLAQVSPFRVLYAVLLTGHAIFCLALRRPRWATFFTAFALFNVFAILRPVGGPAPAPSSGRAQAQASVKLLLANVLTSNREADRLLAVIADEAPDVIALLEVNQRWREQLEPVLAARYSHRLFHPREDNFGLALLSRLPVSVPRVREIGDSELPSIEVTLNPGTAPLRLLVTHPLPPGTPNTARLRDTQLAALAAWVNEDLSAPLAPRPPSIILGDLNATPWCPPLRRLLAQTDLRVAARDHARIAPSWPADVPFLAIPLDHALLDSRIACPDYHIGAAIGSDHLPILVTVTIPSPR